MNYGFDQGRFYIDVVSCSRPAGNMREESDRRAKEIAESSKNLMLSFSGGIDSQSMLHSFYTQDIGIETVFLYMPKYNDVEYEQVRICDKKYNIKTQIIDIDIDSLKEEFLELRQQLDLLQRIHILHRHLAKMIPYDVDFVQMPPDPFIYVSPTSKFYYYQGYHTPEIARKRSFSTLDRKGKNIFFGDSPELLTSVLDDEIYKSALISSNYFDGNGLFKDKCHLRTVDRWDYYVKPLIYGKYWGDELIYFPKFTTIDNIDWMFTDKEYISDGNGYIRKHAVVYPYYDLLDFLKSNYSKTMRVYENVPYDTQTRKSEVGAV